MSVTAPQGWLAAGVRAGTKPSGALDLALVVSEHPASVAGAFTTNHVVGAPIVVSKPRVAKGAARGFVVSAGVANVATGEQGIADAEAVLEAAAAACEIDPAEMIVSATGIIGRRLPLDAVANGIAEAASSLSRDGGADAAAAILTTDAGPKTATRTIEIDGVTVMIGGMAKGAGMIAPALALHATMLVFVTTDAEASPEALRGLLAEHLEPTFNSISVDACTSTSDTVLLFANGASGVNVEGSDAFSRALGEVFAELAYLIVRDGEGASRVLHVEVSGAGDETQAKACAREVATSILVRCAVAGGDPNWGRIAQAIGQTPGLRFDPANVSLSICGVDVARDGTPTGNEAAAAAAMRDAIDVPIRIDLGAGNASWTFRSSDLTPAYVSFNAEYTT